MIESDSLSSIILWGPPGSGKTTLGSIIAHETGANFYSLSGVSSGKADLQKIIDESLARRLVTPRGEQQSFDEIATSTESVQSRAEGSPRNDSKRTILFIDEIHQME